MPLTCVKCSRANPDEAVYCYHDGFALNGHGRGAGPVSVGSQQFPSPFVFPSGRTCRSFDELATACQEDWDGAKELLQQGFFGSFFGGMGRADLARAAEEAKKFGDPDRGLDQLLGKVPTEVLQDPKLRVEPQSISLGTMHVGDDRDIELHLENMGMRLLYGKVMAVDTPWLALGEGQGVSEKIFQFTHDARLTVHVRGAKLRSNNKPLQGKLVVDSNGGDPVTISVRCDVPVRPFPGSGPLSGARSPRQVAEKAKANPKEAAKVFEAGEVQNWYNMNGWTYPVKGPTSSGLSAIQQFFEALGLTPAPKVDINHRSISLQGEPGQQNLRFSLEVKTEEKKPVYAHGEVNQPWLEVGRAKLNGRVASIAVTIPVIPNRPGETLTAKVVVESNGNQRFVVPVTLQIGTSEKFVGDIPVLPVEEFTPIVPAAPPPRSKPDVALAPAPEPLPEPVIQPRRRKQGMGMHWLVAALLGLCLLILVLLDLFRSKPKDEIPDAPKITKSNWQDVIRSGVPNLGVGFTDDKRWGLVMQGEKDPNNPTKSKQLTFGANGETNNTVIRVDKHELIFGRRYQGALTKIYPQKEEIPERYWTSKIEYLEHGIEVVQHVMLVPGSSTKQVKGPDGKMRELVSLDNCLIYYTIKNIRKTNAKPTVAVRVLLDTYIGANDGVPFTIPGRKGFMDTMIDIPSKDIPEFVEAVERPEDANDPGTVARLGLKGIQVPWVENIDEPTRVVICQQPDNPQVKWNWGEKEGEFLPISTPRKQDSCAVIFWDDVPLNKGEVRTVGFTYGLNSIQIAGAKEGGGGGLALSVQAGAARNKPFTVTAYVYNARAGQQVTLDLPKGMSLVSGETAAKTVDGAGKRQKVEWKVVGTELGEFEIKAKSGQTEAVPKKVRVNDKSIFG